MVMVMMGVRTDLGNALLWLGLVCGCACACASAHSCKCAEAERIALDCGGPADSHPLAYTNTLAKTSRAIAGTVYATHAWAPPGKALEYAFQVPADGVYQVRLQFAETWPPNAGGGRRVIDIVVNGYAVKRKLDVYKAAGGLYRPYDVVVPHFRVSAKRNADGNTSTSTSGTARIVVRIVPVVQNAFIAGIIITREEREKSAAAFEAEAENAITGGGDLLSPHTPSSSGSNKPETPAWNSASSLSESPTLSAANGIGKERTMMKQRKEIDLNVTFTRVKEDYPLHVFEAQGSVLRNGSSDMLFVAQGFYGFPDITNKTYGRKFRIGTETGTDKAEAEWVRLADMPTPAVTHMAQWTDGEIFCGAGGFIGRDPGRSGRRVWCYSAVKNAWWRLPDLPEPRAGGGLVLVQHQGQRTLLYSGGVDRERETHSASDHTDYGTTWVLDFERPAQSQSQASREAWQWRDTGQEMPDARNHMAAVNACGRYLFVGGQHGVNEHSGNRPTISEWLPHEGRWAKLPPAPMPHGVGHISASVMPYRCGVLVVGGIENGRMLSNKVLWWNPDSNKWSVVGYYPHRAATPVCGIKGDTIMCATGGDWHVQNQVFVARIRLRAS